MFFPQLFGIVGEKLVYTKDHQYDDPEDLCDDRYLLEVRTSPSYALVKSGIQIQCLYSGLKITAGQRTMSGQNDDLSGQNFGSAVILTGHVNVQTNNTKNFIRSISVK